MRGDARGAFCLHSVMRRYSIFPRSASDSQVATVYFCCDSTRSTGRKLLAQVIRLHAAYRTRFTDILSPFPRALIHSWNIHDSAESRPTHASLLRRNLWHAKIEHSNSRFESIRIDSFCKKNRPFDSLVVMQFFLLGAYLLYSLSQGTQLKAILYTTSTKQLRNALCIL